MHFFYLDESGCGGAELEDPQEPIFVLGGIGVKDQGWVKTTASFLKILAEYFDVERLPDTFELHAHELLSPEGEGHFLGHDRDKRNALAQRLLLLLKERSHQVQYVALEKRSLQGVEVEEGDAFDPSIPYLLAYNYMTTYLEAFAKKHLGHTARGMLIIDVKEQFQEDIEQITHFRRFELPQSRKLKWLVEFTYPVDSVRHPMIQLSDLVIFCVRKFYELDSGYRDTWPIGAKQFYTDCFASIHERVWRKALIDQDGGEAMKVNGVLRDARLSPSTGWKSRYSS